MEKNFEITKEMIRNGMNQGLVEIIGGSDNDNNGEIVCRIGDYWFYFCGAELEHLSLEEFLKVTNKEDNIRSIYEMLKFFSQDKLFEDEYQYYYWFLTENLK